MIAKFIPKYKLSKKKDTLSYDKVKRLKMNIKTKFYPRPGDKRQIRVSKTRHRG
jgi:hypothetical protein